jgi:tryptophan-rich sensory protein
MPDSNAKQSFMDHFSLHNRYSCETAIRNGGVAAFISAAVTGLFAAAGFFINSSDTTFSYLMDPMLTVDVVLIVVLGVLVFRKSRIASTLLVVYFAASKALLWYQLGQAQGLPLSVLLMFYYVTAMRATFIWHASYRNADTAAVHAA